MVSALSQGVTQHLTDQRWTYHITNQALHTYFLGNVNMVLAKIDRSAIFRRANPQNRYALRIKNMYMVEGEVLGVWHLFYHFRANLRFGGLWDPNGTIS